MLPRIPLVEDPWPFVEAGRELSELHLGYESVTPYPLDGLDAEPQPGGPLRLLRGPEDGVRQGPRPRDQEARRRQVDASSTTRGSRCRGIPEAAYRYMLGSRSAIEWIIDRYQVKTDKASGIVNDPNDWSREVGTRATSSTCSPGSSRSASRPCRSSTPACARHPLGAVAGNGCHESFERPTTSSVSIRSWCCRGGRARPDGCCRGR